MPWLSWSGRSSGFATIPPWEAPGVVPALAGWAKPIRVDALAEWCTETARYRENLGAHPAEGSKRIDKEAAVEIADARGRRTRVSTPAGTGIATGGGPHRGRVLNR